MPRLRGEARAEHFLRALCIFRKNGDPPFTVLTVINFLCIVVPSNAARRGGKRIGMVTEELKELKERADAVVLAHYYTDGAVQEMADYVGDSFYLAKVAAKEKRGTIVFCGHFFATKEPRF